MPHGGGHGGFHGGHHGHHGGVAFVPWWGPYLDWDPDDLYANAELTTDDIRAILAAREQRDRESASAKPSAHSVGYVGDERDGLDCLGAVTLTGQDWLNVFKGALSAVADSGDKAKAEEKAKAERKAAAEKSSVWWKVGIGATIAGLATALFMRGR